PPPQRTVPEPLPRRTAREAEPLISTFPGGAWERADETLKRDSSLVALRCGACHGRTSPKQGLSLIDLPALAAEDRLGAVRAVLDRSMPPETEAPLSDSDRAAILRELITDTVTIEQNQNDQ
ncbi:MAG: hypothetical protein WD894_05385, partial [Pirellulales bacterium]